MLTKTLKLRIKDKHAKALSSMAREVNFVWNFCNDLGFRYLQREHRFLSGYDLQKYTKGASKEMQVDSTCIQQVCEEYATRRKQFKRSKLRWRASGGSHRSLGWVPFKSGSAKWVNGQIRYAGRFFGVWDSYGLSEYALRAGSFSEDARGRWYFNVVVHYVATQTEGKTDIGVDLGLKDVAGYSNGEKLSNGRWYRQHEQKLATAQRARRFGRAKAIHAKIANQRKDMLHKESTRLVSNNAAIFIGDVSSLKLVKTKMAKSVLDAGWGMFKTMLQYKGDSAGCIVQVVNEAYSTRTCSSCGSLSGPKGVNGLAVRHWGCCECGSSHDRDTNAAMNILAAGRRSLVAAGHSRLS